ncbi:hypothetical protein PoB_006760000 [Plakobranchus ocellatus]|uniref:Uncharacterized protein n=1 Tax=Plakobranchus ocellatus TaxID=259542 RepID=A0AAV4DAH6_9GAST|nr:hypothetical protein PoB_006760000 [Plakobranchus ocellatus]
MRGNLMVPFPFSNRATDVRPGCKTQRIAPTLRQVADLLCARTKERDYLKTCIVGDVNSCLQCGPTLTRRLLQDASPLGWVFSKSLAAILTQIQHHVSKDRLVRLKPIIFKEIGVWQEDLLYYAND